MDKNQYIGLILMFGLLAVYFMYFSPEPPAVEETPIAEQPATTESEVVANESTSQQVIGNTTAVDTLKYGAFSFAAQPQEETQVVETEELKITLTNLGGRISEVELKKHKDYLGNPVKNNGSKQVSGRSYK